MTTTAVRGDRLGPLRSRDYRLLVAGTTTSSLGNAITPVALAFAVLDLGGSAVASSAWSWRRYALAEVVTVLFGGVLGDRVPRQLMMQGVRAPRARSPRADRRGAWSAAGRACRCSAVLGLVNGCLAALSGPLVAGDDPADRAGRGAARGRHAAPAGAEHRRRGRASRSAGMLVAAFGPGWAIAVDAATFAVAAACYALMRVPPHAVRRTRRACSTTSATAPARCSGTPGCGC